MKSKEKGPAVSPEKEIFSLRDRFMCLFRKEFYSIIPFYLTVLIPSASVMAYLCRTYLDPFISARIGWWRFPQIYPANLYIFAIILILAGCGLLWTYSYLILEGHGGPCPPFTSKTDRLVNSGPYAHVRHPSILFKLLGVTGLGVAFESLSFILLIVPLLLCISLYLNLRCQEEPLDERLKGEYREYRENTPALIPSFFRRKAR